MKTITAEPSDLRNQKPDSCLIWHDEEFPILLAEIIKLSQKFKDRFFLRCHLDRPYSITSNVSRDSVLELTKALRNEYYTVNPENAIDLSLLSEELIIASFQDEVTRFITDHADALLIPRIQRALESSEDTLLLEEMLRANLVKFVNNPNILSLPLNLLSRVIPRPIDCGDEQFPQLFEFLLRLFDNFGPCASILFRGLDLSRLNSAQILEFRNRPNFLWGFFGDTASETLLSSLSFTISQREAFASQHSQLAADRVEFDRFATRWTRDLENLRDEISNLPMKLENRIAKLEKTVLRLCGCLAATAKGQTVPLDQRELDILIREAANDGNATCQFLHGSSLQHSGDIIEGLEYLRRSADHGHSI
jgi:hypothetical protein